MENINYFKEFIKYSFLNILGMIGLSCYIFADTFFISKGLGANGLTALNLAIPIYSFINGSGLMLGMGGAIKYSIYKSQKKFKNMNIIFTNTIYLACLLFTIYILIGVFLSKLITTLLGADEDVFIITNIYLKVIFLFSPVFILNDIMICFVRNDGSPQLSMAAMIGGSMSNILLDYVFIFLLKMGIFGAAFSTGLSPLISMSILLIHLLKKKNNFHFTKIKLKLRILKSIFLLGFPSFITEISSGIVIIVFNTIILKLQGNIGVAAYGVIANLSLVIVSIFTGIAQGMQPLISKAYGYNDKLNIKKILKYAVITITITSILIYLIIFLYSSSITHLFNSENNLELQNIAVLGLKLYFTAIIFAGFNIIISTFFISTEMAFPANIISILRGLIIIVPMAFLLAALFGIIGVWLAFPVTELLVAIFGFIMYYIFKNKKF